MLRRGDYLANFFAFRDSGVSSLHLLKYGFSSLQFSAYMHSFFAKREKKKKGIFIHFSVILYEIRTKPDMSCTQQRNLGNYKQEW